MNEHDFDKLFGSQLPDLADKNWGKLQGKLENFNLECKLAKLVWALWGLGIFGGLMLATTGGLFYQMMEHKQQLKKLESQLVAVNNTHFLKQDTVFQRVIVHDTIYRTSVYHTKTIDGMKLNQNIIAQNQGNENVYYEKNQHLLNQESAIVERNKYLDLKTINSKKTIFDKFKITIKNIVNPDSISEDSVINLPKFSLKPASVSVGLTGGYQSANGNIFQAGDGKQFGFRTVLGYNDRLGRERWGVVLDFQKHDYTFLNTEAEEGVINLPNILPQFTDSRLKGANVREISAYQLGVGLRYNLLFSRKFKPYFGVNWAVQIPNQYLVNFYTEDRFDRRERRYNVVYDTNLPTISNIFGGNVGVNYQLTNHFSTGLEVYYQSQLSASISTPNALGARFGLNYHF